MLDVLEGVVLVKGLLACVGCVLVEAGFLLGVLVLAEAVEVVGLCRRDVGVVVVVVGSVAGVASEGGSRMGE